MQRGTGDVHIVVSAAFHTRRQEHAHLAISFIGGELPFALISLPLLMLYNGKRGQMPGVVFYAFYPVHLIVLRSIARIAFGIPAV